MQSKLHHKNICKIPLSVEPIQNKHFLKKDKTLSQIRKNSHRNFINLVDNLILHKTSSNKLSTYYLAKEFNNNFLYKDWIIEKITELGISLKHAI